MNPARVLCAVLVLSASGLWAQSPAAAGVPAPGQPGVQASTVTFTVEVTDKAGHFISGLQPSDFTLLDNKSPSTVAAFAEHRPTPATPVTAVLAIDTVNMGFDGDSIARTQAMDFLRGFHGPLPYPMSLVLVTDRGVQQVGTVSEDPAVLLTAVNGLGGQLRALPRSAGFWGAAERQEMSVNTLSRLVAAMTKMPGRKLLFWIGPGWPTFDSPTVMYSNTQLRRIFAEIVALSNQMTKAQVTLYDVDPLGNWDAGSFRTFVWQGYTNPVRHWDKALAGNLALQVLAVQSGGLVLNGSNDIAAELSTCARDGDAWYTISFAPEASEKPDTWHSVQMKLNKPGLTVRMRPGYYAQP